jgi:photosystem II stability/assembly factor-like uncharacterized protein
MNRARLLIVLVLDVTMLVVSASWAQVWREAVTPTYPGMSLNDVFFIDASTGWIVGGNSSTSAPLPKGIVLKSTDGGLNWTKYVLDSTGVASTVYFRTATEGYAGGGSRKFYKTTNGGTVWTKTEVTSIADTDATIRSVYFSDASKGWMLTSRSSANGRILHTTDGGATWTLDLTVAANNMIDMSFSGPNRGIATGKSIATLYYTKDGTTWTAAPTITLSPTTYTRSDVRGVTMVDSLLGYAVGWGSLVGPQPSVLLKTTNGGETWTQLVQADANKTYDNIYSVYFKDANTGVAVGGGGRATIVLKTTDGGTNWIPIDFAGGAQLNSLAGVGDLLCAVGADGVIYRSTDLGATWTLRTPFLSGNYNTMQFPTATAGFAAGFDAIMISTANNGSTWASGSVSTGKLAPNVNDISFVNGSIGYAVHSYRMVTKTTNAGASWAMVLPDTTSATVSTNGVFFIDQNLGFAVGALSSTNGVVYKTTDGGASWTTKSAVIAKQLYDVGFGSATAGAVVGNSKLAAYTTDGGTTWTAATFNGVPTSKASVALRGVKFLAATLAIAVGDTTILKSTDAGATWNYVTTSVKSQLQAIDNFNATTAYAVGTKEVWKTTDAGDTWTNIIDSTLMTGALKAIAVDKSGNVWVAGPSGYMYTTAGATDVSPAGGLPSAFRLDQNYPNPFNPTTVIGFELPAISNVKVAVFDILGREVAPLLNEQKEAGAHTVTWNANGMASGVYIYRLTAGAFTETRKMVLVK